MTHHLRPRYITGFPHTENLGVEKEGLKLEQIQILDHNKKNAND